MNLQQIPHVSFLEGPKFLDEHHKNLEKEIQEKFHNALTQKLGRIQELITDYSNSDPTNIKNLKSLRGKFKKFTKNYNKYQIVFINRINFLQATIKKYTFEKNLFNETIKGNCSYYNSISWNGLGYKYGIAYRFLQLTSAKNELRMPKEDYYWFTEITPSPLKELENSIIFFSQQMDLFKEIITIFNVALNKTNISETGNLETYYEMHLQQFNRLKKKITHIDQYKNIHFSILNMDRELAMHWEIIKKREREIAILLDERKVIYNQLQNFNCIDINNIEDDVSKSNEPMSTSGQIESIDQFEQLIPLHQTQDDPLDTLDLAKELNEKKLDSVVEEMAGNINPKCKEAMIFLSKIISFEEDFVYGMIDDSFHLQQSTNHIVSSSHAKTLSIKKLELEESYSENEKIFNEAINTYREAFDFMKQTVKKIDDLIKQFLHEGWEIIQ